jgi:hypothetical protein
MATDFTLDYSHKAVKIPKIKLENILNQPRRPILRPTGAAPGSSPGTAVDPHRVENRIKTRVGTDTTLNLGQMAEKELF